MSANTKIEWTDRSWNPTRGCRRISPGCKNCYAERHAYRFSGTGLPYEGLVELGRGGPRWTGKTLFDETSILAPIHWRRPRRIFVDSMSDLFFEGFTEDQIDQVLAVMLLAPHHTFQVLTKRASRMRSYLSDPDLYDRVLVHVNEIRNRLPKKKLSQIGVSNPALFPPSWIWWGVSVEDQSTADERIPLLRGTPAAVRFISYEPALEAVDFRAHLHYVPCSQYPAEVAVGWGSIPCDCRPYQQKHAQQVDWIIVGGESGPGARSFNPTWARDVVTQCRTANVACFVKQLGSNVLDFSGAIRSKKGNDMSEWPAELRVREFPAQVTR